MSKRCSDILTGLTGSAVSAQPGQHEQTGDVLPALSGTLARFLKASDEIRSELEAIKGCPAPCEDGTAQIRTASGLCRRLPCPARSPNCLYGIRLTEELTWYVARIMARVGVPRRHVENFAGCRESYPVSEALRWPFRGFLVLCGRTGSGKSFGAARLIQAYLEGHITDRLDRGTWEAADRRGDSVLWLGAKDITDDRGIHAKASSVSLLAIDDLGREDDTKAARAAMCSAVSKRYDSKLATVITTELSMAGISKRYGRYLTGRLLEDSGAGGGVVDFGDAYMRGTGRV